MKQFCLFLISLFFFLSVYSQPKSYSDSRGGTIVLPLGDLSFADEVVEFKAGNPRPIKGFTDSLLSLAQPNYNGFAGNFTSLGCEGSLTLKFTDNALINVAGPDLFVFEVGKFVETTLLEISKDGKKWINVGKISGGVASVDIDSLVKPNELFYYVRLSDLKTECRGKWPGADIDAVAAIGSGRIFNFDNSVLFNFNEYDLLNNSKNELDKITEYINVLKPSKVIIEGHTDSIGTKEYNQQLSQKRAKSVYEYIAAKAPTIKNKIEVIGYGSSQPIAPNISDKGKELNRRVTVIIIP